MKKSWGVLVVLSAVFVVLVGCNIKEGNGKSDLQTGKDVSSFDPYKNDPYKKSESRTRQGTSSFDSYEKSESQTVQSVSSLSPDSYEVDDEMSLAKEVGVGETQNRNLHVSTDIDWIKISTMRGKYYIVSNNFGTSRGYLELYDAAGNQKILTNGFTSTLAIVGDGKVWYVKVSSHSVPLSYTVTLEELKPDSYEVDGEMSLAKEIGVGETQNRNFHVSTDIDWIKISTVSGKSYIVSNNFGISEGHIELFNAGGNQKAFRYGSHPTLAILGDGNVWYVKVSSYSAPVSYTVTLKEVP
ncbi:MAG: hypothetical protein N2314_07685 [Brevinematales bacterium]|nr:hypothetical protein [Brevinematales bacterium]